MLSGEHFPQIHVIRKVIRQLAGNVDGAAGKLVNLKVAEFRIERLIRLDDDLPFFPGGQVLPVMRAKFRLLQSLFPLIEFFFAFEALTCLAIFIP